MSLVTVDPPILAYESVRSRLADLAAVSAFGTPSLRRAAPKALALSTPHRVAVLPGDRINAKLLLRTHAVEKGWRFLVLNGNKAVATADCGVANTGEYRFGQINEGPFVAGTEEAIRRAEKDKRVAKGQFEPVLLMVPNLKLVALWLRDLDGDKDQLMAIPPAPSELRPYELHGANDFAGRLVELARSGKRRSRG